MAKALTVKTLENLKPGATRRETPDGAVPGLYIVVQPSGKKSWAYRYRFNGRPRKLTLGPCPGIDLKCSRELAREALRKVAGGTDPGVEKKATKADALVPVNDLVESVVARFVSQYARRNLKAVTAHEIERLLEKEFVARWRGRRLSQIRRADIHAVLDDIVTRGSPITANRALGWLRRVCSWAIERGLLDANPCSGIRPPAAETARDRVLSDDELVAVWRAAERLEPPYNAFVKMLVLSGQRRAEIAGLRWREIDFDSKLWTLPKERAKNGVEHKIPLSDLAVNVLNECPRIAGSEFVFTLSGRRPITAFWLTKQRLDALLSPDMPVWVFHDLRRSFASGCARLGIAVHVVEAALNHLSGTIRGVAAVYNRYSYDTEKRACMTMWARYVEQLASAEPTANVVEGSRK